MLRRPKHPLEFAILRRQGRTGETLRELSRSLGRNQFYLRNKLRDVRTNGAERRPPTNDLVQRIIRALDTGGEL